MVSSCTPVVVTVWPETVSYVDTPDVTVASALLGLVTVVCFVAIFCVPCLAGVQSVRSLQA